MDSSAGAGPGLRSVVTVERPGDHMAVVTLNRPEARNAVNEAVAEALARAVRDLDADPEVRAVVLAAAGEGVFCAGADLKVIAAGRADTLWTPEGGFAGFVHAPRAKPWIAAVDGLALAGGFEIALACDMIVASERAAFGLPEVTRGLIAAAGGLYRLSRWLPRAIALEMIATGAPLDAARAASFGLVNRLVAPGRAREAALSLAEAVSANAPVAVQESLAVARQASDLPEAGLRALSDTARQRVRRTDDYREGPAAFIEKRPPRWTGS